MSPSSKKLAQLLANSQAPNEDWLKAFRLGFTQLRHEVDMHPIAVTPSAIFAAAAHAARTVSADNLPLGMGLVMHLYPLCALRCVPLPWWSPANYRRQRLLHDIDRRSLILANAGSERAAGAHLIDKAGPVTVTRVREGVRVDGRFDYVSLANVADLVLFSAPLGGADASLFCIADLRADTARIGAARFTGSMRLSDTCSVDFENHLVPSKRFVLVPNSSALGCMTQYQRSWFHLLAGEAHLARIEFLQRRWQLPRTSAETAGRNELTLLRDYALRLLDEAHRPSALGPGIDKLSQVTAALKLRISWMAQSLADALRADDPTAADELRFFKRQPTSDDRILLSIGVAPDRDPAVSNSSRAVTDTSPATHLGRGEYSWQI